MTMVILKKGWFSDIKIREFCEYEEYTQKENPERNSKYWWSNYHRTRYHNVNVNAKNIELVKTNHERTWHYITILKESRHKKKQDSNRKS